MKVLFAVSNESISDQVVKKYQQEYKEIISSKKVYYFNAILKELQKDKTYDRIVISEDLEAFTNTNYDTIDKFIFDRLDSISDEACDKEGNDIPIILICSDRRAKQSDILVKMFGIGVYNALIGQDRSIDLICDLIHKPRTKKEAKLYYRIDSEDVNYKRESTENVSEVEIQNIITYYKRLGKDEAKYIECFDNIAAQYTDAQLKVIVKFLPLGVRAVLESSSEKYQQLMTNGGGVGNQEVYKLQKAKNEEEAQRKREDQVKVAFIENELEKNKINEPIVIPKKGENIKKSLNKVKDKKDNDGILDIDDLFSDDNDDTTENEDEFDVNNIINNESSKNNQLLNNKVVPEPLKKRRGRPKKIVENDEVIFGNKNQTKMKNDIAEQILQMQELSKQEEIFDNDNSVIPEENSNEFVEEKRKRGRPSKKVIAVGKSKGLNNKKQNSEIDDTLDLFGLSSDYDVLKEEKQEPIANPINNEPDDLFDGIDTLPGFDDDIFEEKPRKEERVEPINSFNNYAKIEENNINKELEKTVNSMMSQTDRVIMKNQKMVSFIGTSKNGTTFIVNSLGEILSRQGVKTAILDLSKNKNDYYIYTNNEERLRKTAIDSVKKLKTGIAEGIVVNNNLTVYTSLPENEDLYYDYQNIINTLLDNYSVILLDCDFNTPIQYLAQSQEIYLVQSMDVLTIQPLTAYLREMKAKNILDESKIRVIINKHLKVKGVNDRAIVGGLANYNDPSMSFMTELFNKDNMKYTTISFDNQTYVNYLEGLVDCKISINKYSKNTIAELNKLSNIVYPMINTKVTSKKNKNTYNDYKYEKDTTFSSNINDTLNKMKNNY